MRSFSSYSPNESNFIAVQVAKPAQQESGWIGEEEPNRGGWHPTPHAGSWHRGGGNMHHRLVEILNLDENSKVLHRCLKVTDIIFGFEIVEIF